MVYIYVVDMFTLVRKLDNIYQRKIMAEFKIEIADADVGRVLTAVASNYNRPEKVIIDKEEVDNPETVAQFANRMVREFLSENVKAYEIRLAKEQAANSVDTSVTINDPAV